MRGEIRARLLFQFRQRLPHPCADGLERGAAIAHDLAAEQVVGLDAGGAFVDGGDAGVAQVLRRAGFLDVAHAAMDLDAERGDLDAALGEPALDHRDHQVDEGLARLPLGRVGDGSSAASCAAATT